MESADLLSLAIYLIPGGVIFAAYLSTRARTHRRSTAAREASIKAGLTEPASLHPVIDPALCTGAGACVHACPEGNVLGLIDGRGEMINPTKCIGHGACMSACPTNAISLVFGTEKRGVEIPLVQSNFETNVPGIFIAGELGGMGLIRNAIEQGRHAMEAVNTLGGVGAGDQLDVVIVGAGPAGFAASLAALEHKLKFVTVEQETLGGTVAHYPRGKLVMTAPVVLPLVGKVRFKETTKEALLEFWQKVERQTGIKINYQERMEQVAPTDTGFEVRTNKATYRTRAVLLAIGRRGTPRKLDVPGEDQTKVVYHLIDPEQYQGQHVLVVGGGDSALEAAASIAEEPGTTVSVSYRNEAFSRAKEKNRQKIASAEAAGRLRVLLKSQVKQITPTHVWVECENGELELENDSTLICAGGILPTPFLKEIGIAVETKHGTA